MNKKKSNSAKREREKRENLREVGALGPNAAVMANDGGGGEVAAVDVGHQVVVYVGLPRHRFVGEKESKPVRCVEWERTDDSVKTTEMKNGAVDFPTIITFYACGPGASVCVKCLC